MKSKKKPIPEFTMLRRRAEEAMAKSAKTTASRSGTDSRRLVHELEVHQVELELQNEELRRARAELEANYDDLYNLAPVGYFTLTLNGDIENANLTGAILLGQTHDQMLGRRFEAFVAPQARPDFNDFWRRVIGGSVKVGCVLKLLKGGITPVMAYVEATKAGPNSRWRVMVVDITAIGIVQYLGERKQAEVYSDQAGSGERAVRRTRRNPPKPDN